VDDLANRGARVEIIHVTCPNHTIPVLCITDGPDAVEAIPFDAFVIAKPF
jgi:hypothetical protein